MSEYVFKTDSPIKTCSECDYRCGLNIIARKDQDSRHENCPLVELPNNPWHTGTPTEEGDYVVKTKNHGNMVLERCRGNWKLHNDNWIFRLDKVIAWQKIEPYKGE